MLPYIESRYDQFIQDLESVVNLDSGSGYVPGLESVLSFFQGRFEKLGWRVDRHAFEGGKVPCLEISNKLRMNNGDPFDFLFLGHADTVMPPGTAKERPFSIHNGRGMGPGVCDMKAGLVTMLHVAETVEHAGISKRVSLCMGINSDEEAGSRGSRRWFESLATRSRRVLVFEPCRATGHRVIQRKGVGGWEVHCHGKAAHAGAEPDKGANAVLEVAHQVLAMADLAKPHLGTSVSVTTISGGTVENVIPDFAKAGADVRFSTVEEARRIEECFRNLNGKGCVEGVRVEVQGEINRLPMVPSEGTLRLWESIAAIGKRIGLEMKLIHTGGCSDGNFTSALGIPTIDAMGPRGGGAHSKEEFLELDSITPNIRLVCEILKAASEGSLP